MKLKAYHSILIFAILVMSAAFSSVSNYRKAQYAIVQDMNKALALTLQENKYKWITPFFKQKTAYEISTRDWSSDVCSSDLDQKYLLGFILGIYKLRC